MQRVRFCLFPPAATAATLSVSELICSASRLRWCCMEPSQVRRRDSQAPGSEGGGGWGPGLRSLEGERVVLVH